MSGSVLSTKIYFCVKRIFTRIHQAQDNTDGSGGDVGVMLEVGNTFMDLCFAKEYFLFDHQYINAIRYGNPDDIFVHGRDDFKHTHLIYGQIDKCDETGLFLVIVYSESYIISDQLETYLDVITKFVSLAFAYNSEFGVVAPYKVLKII